MILKCNNKLCMHEWDFKGLAKFYTSCPICRHLVKINREEKNNETQ